MAQQPQTYFDIDLKRALNQSLNEIVQDMNRQKKQKAIENSYRLTILHLQKKLRKSQQSNNELRRQFRIVRDNASRTSHIHIVLTAVVVSVILMVGNIAKMLILW